MPTQTPDPTKWKAGDKAPRITIDKVKDITKNMADGPPVYQRSRFQKQEYNKMSTNHRREGREDYMPDNSILRASMYHIAHPISADVDLLDRCPHNTWC